MRYLFLLLAAVLFVSCGMNSSDGDPENTSPVEMGVIIENDDFFPGSHWNDPHVLKMNDEYIMYASSDIAWDGVVRIYRLTSSDGISWTISNSADPVFEPGSAGAWDSHSTETPAVVYYQDEYHLFYTGYDVAYDFIDAGDPGDPWDNDYSSKHFGIGHAVSSDGITWTRTGIQPVHSSSAPYDPPNLTFDQYTAGEPGPVVYNNKIYLYFTAVGAAAEVNTTWQTIGLMTYVGTDWDTPRRVLVPDLDLYPRESGADEYAGYSTPNAVIIDEHVHLFFDVALNDPWKQVTIHHAVSTDGETGWVQDDSAYLEREDYFWTANEIRSPSAMMDGNTLYLYFAGHYNEETAPELCIGLNMYEVF